jgi:hypothetical protein
MKKIKHQVIDNFLNKEDFIALQSHMIGNDFPWFFEEAITFTDKKYSLEYYMTHLFYGSYKVNSPSFSLVIPIIKKLEMKAIIRIKGNLYHNMGKEIINEAHRDYDFKHKGAILYINNNNGFTILADGTKIKNTENRLLMFDPSELHSSTHCTDQKARFNININYF